MDAGRDTMRIEGIVQPCFLDSICLSHRICVVATDGHVYEVEPNYVGLYLERFIDHHVIAHVESVTNGKSRSVVRISSLKVLDGPTTQESSAAAGGAAPSDTNIPERILSELEVGVIEA
jgi:hypothetical protein